MDVISIVLPQELLHVLVAALVVVVPAVAALAVAALVEAALVVVALVEAALVEAALVVVALVEAARLIQLYRVILFMSLQIAKGISCFK